MTIDEWGMCFLLLRKFPRPPVMPLPFPLEWGERNLWPDEGNDYSASFVFFGG